MGDGTALVKLSAYLALSLDILSPTPIPWSLYCSEAVQAIRMGSMGEPEIPYVDVLLVGAGFASYTLLNRLRRLGLSVSIYEKGSASGGIWHWNCYPGARVDSDTPIYQLFDKELWEDFTFKERYAGWPELRRYFKHIEKKWGVLSLVHPLHWICIQTLHSTSAGSQQHPGRRIPHCSLAAAWRQSEGQARGTDRNWCQRHSSGPRNWR